MLNRYRYLWSVDRPAGFDGRCARRGNDVDIIIASPLAIISLFSPRTRPHLLSAAC